MTRSMFDALYLFAAVPMLAVSLLLVSASMVQAETADERALRSAAADGNRDKVESLLARGTDPNVPDYNGWTALHHAANIAETSILTVLLEAGADPDARNSRGESSLHLAAAFPYFEPASQAANRVLLQYGADPDIRDTNKRTPLHVAARMHQHAVSIQDMLQSGANPNQRDFAGITPLHSAVSGSSKFSADVVYALVDGGASASIASGRGETPLQLFARVGSNDGRIVRALVEGGANPDRKNPEGETPLHTAIRNGGNAEKPTVIEALLAAGADPCIKDAAGYIPYNTAREGGTVHTMLANAGGSDIGCQGSDAPMADYLVDSADWPGETTTRANIRTGPGRDYGVLETLDADTAVQVTGTIRNTDWLRIEVVGEMVFVHASLVREAAPATALESGTDDQTPADDYMKVVTWKRPLCVVDDGTLARMHTGQIYPAIVVGVCVGIVEAEVTGRCDTRTSECDWPCGDGKCYEEWTGDPDWPFSEYADQARAVAEAARIDLGAMQADGFAKLEEYMARQRDEMPQVQAATEAQITAVIEEDVHEDTMVPQRSCRRPTVASLSRKSYPATTETILALNADKRISR